MKSTFSWLPPPTTAGAKEGSITKGFAKEGVFHGTLSKAKAVSQAAAWHAAQPKVIGKGSKPQRVRVPLPPCRTFKHALEQVQRLNAKPTELFNEDDKDDFCEAADRALTLLILERA